jgi:quercetin dioxygenase-like cupin family protein
MSLLSHPSNRIKFKGNQHSGFTLALGNKIILKNRMSNIPFQVIDWPTINPIEKKGETGTVISRGLQFEGLRVRMIEYSAGYLADHWCQKGHIVHCLEGEFVSEMENDEQFTLKKGMTYIVSDDVSSHRSKTTNGVKLLIIDGDFLKSA